jgi:branched-chain amino acid transport system permease protein
MRSLWIGGVNPYVGILAGGVVAVAFGLIVGFPTFRLRGIYFSIGTLALAEILRRIVQNSLPVVALLPHSYLIEYDLLPRYYLALMLALASTLATFALVKSRVGLGMMAIREDEEAAKASGVNAFKHKLLALLISSLLAGLAGGLFAFYQASYYYEYPFSPHWSFEPLITTFVGGVGTVVGPIIGSAFYVILKELLPRVFIEVHLIVFGALFIVVVILLPGGIIELVSRVRHVTTTLKHVAEHSTGNARTRELFTKVFKPFLRPSRNRLLKFVERFARDIFISEVGWYSRTVKEETSKGAGEEAKAGRLT